jgi:uncharacterized membrane protein (UPF0127 family)
MIALLFLPSLAGAQTRVGDKTGDKVRFGETQIIVDSGFGATRLKVMFARTPDQLRQGLMYRTTIKPWDGMLFDMGIVQPGNFWMRNTLIPLDIIFIKADGTVDSIGEGVPLSLKPPPSWASNRAPSFATKYSAIGSASQRAGPTRSTPAPGAALRNP